MFSFEKFNVILFKNFSSLSKLSKKNERERVRIRRVNDDRHRQIFLNGFSIDSEVSVYFK